MTLPTLTLDDLATRVAEPLPPCQMMTRPRVGPPGGPAGPACGATPAVALVTFTCIARCRPRYRRSACAAHLQQMQRERLFCGRCDAPVVFEVSS